MGFTKKILNILEAIHFLLNNLMRITLDQVRTALVSIANQKGRPDDFGMGVIRAVYESIQYEYNHPLKNIVMQEIFTQFGHLYKNNDNPEEVNIEEALEKILKVKNFYAGQKVLVSRSGVSERTISLLIRKKMTLTVRIWKRIEPVIDDVINELDRHHTEKEKKSHGKYVTYRKGCRCDPCRIAWRFYINDRISKRNNTQPISLDELQLD